MAVKKFASAIALVIALTTSAAAQIQGGPLPTNPLPNVRVQTPTFAVENFTTGSPTCDTRARTARVDMNAVLRPAATQISGDTASVDILVDGASIGARVLPVQRGIAVTGAPAPSIRVTQPLRVNGLDGQHRVQFVINRNARSAEQTFSFHCYSAVAPSIQAPNVQVRLPDVAIGPMAIIWYEPPQPDFDPCHGAGRNLFGDCNLARSRSRWYEIPGSAFTQTDFNTTVPIWRVTGHTCPREGQGEASVTITIAVSFSANDLVQRTDGWQLPAGVVEEGFYRYPYQSETRIFTPGVLYADARHTTRAVQPGYQSFPVGHEWVMFHRTIPCTANGEFVFQLDQRNVLREGDETNNTLRFRYRTMLP